jgi:hypothetical protein
MRRYLDAKRPAIAKPFSLRPHESTKARLKHFDETNHRGG